MKLIALSEDQLSKLKEMWYELKSWDCVSDIWFKVHWLEICLYFLSSRVAEVHGKQPFTTPEWSKRLVLQKLINELPTVNPIDTLYDIWKNPENYAQTL